MGDTMFSDKARCIYKNNQLAEVICQLRFPEILTIGANEPVAFQDAIRSEYPQYAARNEMPAPKVVGAPGNLQLENQKPTVNYTFSSADGAWRVNLTNRFISLTCSRYTDWETFAKKLDTPLASFIRLYQPAYFERVGLRYMNFFSRQQLDLQDVPFSELFQSPYLGILGEEDVDERNTNRCGVDAEVKLRGGCIVKLHAGPGLVKKNGQPDPEVKFIFDQDLYMGGNVPVNYAAGALQTLHDQAYPIFRGAITDTLHNAMAPEND